MAIRSLMAIKIGNLRAYLKYPKEVKGFSLFGFEERKWKDRFYRVTLAMQTNRRSLA
jgi:hypothetical protein